MMLAAIALVACSGSDEGDKGNSEGRGGGRGSFMSEPPTTVEVAKVQIGSFTTYQVTNGRLEPDSRAPVFARVAEMVESVKVDVGDRVKKGDVLAVLRKERFFYSRMTSESALNQSKERVREARLEYDRRLEDLVRMLQVTFESGPRSEEVTTTGDQLKAQLDDARREWLSAYASYQLGAKDSDAVARSDKARDAWDAATLNYMGFVIQHLQFGSSSLFSREEIALARVEAEKSQAAWKIAIANEQSAFAQLQSADLELRESEIRAPASGVIIERLIQPFDMAANNQQVFTIAELDALKLELSLPETTARWLRDPVRGSSGRITPESATAVLLTATAYREGRYLGYIDLVSPVVDANEGTIPVRVRTLAADDDPALREALLRQLTPEEFAAASKTPPNSLRPGMWVEAKVVASSRTNALVLPSTAVVNGKVYVVGKSIADDKPASGDATPAGDSAAGKGPAAGASTSGRSGRSRGGAGSAGGAGGSEGTTYRVSLIDISEVIAEQAEGQTMLQANELVQEGQFVVTSGIEYLKDGASVKVQKPSPDFLKAMGEKTTGDKGKSDKASGDSSSSGARKPGPDAQGKESSAPGTGPAEKPAAG